MKATLLWALVVLGACQATRTSTFFHDFPGQAPTYVARSGQAFGWTDRLHAGGGGKPSYKLPKTQLISLETSDPVGAEAEKELFERLEVEIVRSLFQGGARLTARDPGRDVKGAREFSWQYEADGRAGLITAWGIRHADIYEVTITVHEVGGVR